MLRNRNKSKARIAYNILHYISIKQTFPAVHLKLSSFLPHIKQCVLRCRAKFQLYIWFCSKITSTFTCGEGRGKGDEIFLGALNGTYTSSIVDH